MTATLSSPTRSIRCLNGWWDFLPLTEAHSSVTAPPRTGWHTKSFLVPSWWNKSLTAYRPKGAQHYFSTQDASGTLSDIGQYEFLFDAYGYPSAWTNAKAGWLRRTLTLDALPPGRRLEIVFDAVAPQCMVFVNGQCAGRNTDAMLPLALDVTSLVHAGDNELAVLITDYDRDEHGRTITPSGNFLTASIRGIWQNVWLIERNDLYVSDITIRTSTRTKTLFVRVEITNDADTARTVTCAADAAPWSKGSAPHDARAALALGRHTRTILPHTTETVIIERAWPRAQWWSPEHPALYWLRTRLEVMGRVCDMHAERFGFREVWIDGPHLMLNDHPVHLFSDWGHKVTPFHHTEAWIRQWFGMLRDAHMNHTRLHTHPHLPLTLDIADEEGILITGETGIHGSGANQAADTPAFWQHARSHVQRFVRRDKNHPALILWSVENEMRWNRDTTALTREELPKLRALFNELDPTRTAYHEGDSSLWDERTQPLISRHYHKECSGLGWWQRTQPLHSGEMALYHYAGPNNTCHLAGDEVWADYHVLDRAAATDAALIIESGRTLGVCCFGPWNLSCLENLRPDARAHRLSYDDYTAPGAKPLRVKPHSSEFEFWKEGKGYTPLDSFAIQARAFRPLAVIDRSQRTQYVAGARFTRELFVVNDTPADVRGTLDVTLRCGQRVLAKKSWRLRIARGHIAAHTFACTLPARAGGRLTYAARFTGGRAARDAWQRRILVAPPLSLPKTAPCPDISVFGPGSLRHALTALGVPHRYVPSLQPEALAGARVLILEAGTVTSGDAQRAAMHAFASSGGRVVVLEQEHSLFPALPLEDKPVLRVFRRAFQHPVLTGLADHQLDFWGDDSYAAPTATSCVAHKLYHKDGRQNICCLLDADEGAFGNGGFDFMALCEAPVGDGLVIACQMRVTELFEHIPAAQRLVLNMLQRALRYRSAPRPVVVCDGSDPAAACAAANAARSGAQVIINNATTPTLSALSSALKVPLRVKDVGPVYQLVRAARERLLNGVSNWDTCGIERFSYCNDQAENMVVAQRCLSPVARLEPLLVTATHSCLREMFVDNGKVEPLRAHTITRFLFRERAPMAIGLGRLRVGAGALYLNQYAPPEARTRFHTLATRLAANLGAARRDSVLDAGPRVAPAARSNGQPRTVWVLQHACDDALRDEVLRAAHYTGERLPPAGVLARGTWEERSFSEGVPAGAAPASHALWLYYRLHAPAARKNVKLDIDVPNPNALTFLETSGTGTLALFINGLQIATQTMSGAATVFPDLELEQGWNQILLAWTPATGSAALRMQWRTISGQPETLFDFC